MVYLINKENILKKGGRKLKTVKGFLLKAELDNLFTLTMGSQTIKTWRVRLKKPFRLFGYKKEYYVGVDINTNLKECIGQKVTLTVL